MEQHNASPPDDDGLYMSKRMHAISETMSPDSPASDLVVQSILRLLHSWLFLAEVVPCVDFHTASSLQQADHMSKLIAKTETARQLSARDADGHVQPCIARRTHRRRTPLKPRPSPAQAPDCTGAEAHNACLALMAKQQPLWERRLLQLWDYMLQLAFGTNLFCLTTPAPHVTVTTQPDAPAAAVSTHRLVSFRVYHFTVRPDNSGVQLIPQPCPHVPPHARHTACIRSRQQAATFIQRRKRSLTRTRRSGRCRDPMFTGAGPPPVRSDHA